VHSPPLSQPTDQRDSHTVRVAEAGGVPGERQPPLRWPAKL